MPTALILKKPYSNNLVLFKVLGITTNKKPRYWAGLDVVKRVNLF